ncbi:8-oxoguanine DNA glycosylase OGG fold protein [Micromonospora profundi]|uniref:8-oxoguanine DNA glycosylase OGG fold protein n=1 Tax=Micromonospora profundi TaxID=1420889 RepID=UPI0037FAC25C
MIAMSNDCVPVPSRLRELLRRWVAEGRQPQGGMIWNRSTWLASLPEHQGLLAELPDRLDRDHVKELGRRAGNSPGEAVRAFVATMVWGYGLVGYGAFRTARVLRENDEAPRILREVALRTRRDGGADAFEWLGQHRLRYLGVSFATKYLFFCGGAEASPALVLDRRVQRWLSRYADLHVSLNWNADDYRRYLCLVTDWSRELDLKPDELEYLMFADDGSQQIAAEMVSGNFDEVAVLDALDEAATAFAELPGGTDLYDLDDFERGVRQLRRIVLARGATRREPPE